MKVNKITKINRGLYVHICPLCGTTLVSAGDEELMPEFSICDCDKNSNKKPVYELYEEDGSTMIRRNTYPRFSGKVTMGQFSDIEDIQWVDYTTDSIALAKAMRKAGEFLTKRKNL